LLAFLAIILVGGFIVASIMRLRMSRSMVLERSVAGVRGAIAIGYALLQDFGG